MRSNKQVYLIYTYLVYVTTLYDYLFFDDTNQKTYRGINCIDFRKEDISMTA